MSLALEAAAPFLLLILPGILPLIFFVHHRLICAASSAPAAFTSTICVCVSFLAPLAALSASFGIAALAHSGPQPLRVAQNAVQCLVELGYRTAIIHLIVPHSTTVDSSHVSLSSKDLRRHNIILLVAIFGAFLFSILHLTLPAIPISVPSAMGLAAALLPIPLLVHLALSTPSHRVRRIWTFVAVLQFISAPAAILRVPVGVGYVIARAVCASLWGSGILILFYALLVAPLPPTIASPEPRRRPKFALLTPVPPRVHYHTRRQFSTSTGVVTTEDFTALRDPFASPPPVSPISPASPASSASPRPLRPSTPSPMRREVRGDAQFLSDEAFLSQVLWHSLTREACAECPSPPESTARDVQAVREVPEDVEMQALKVVRTVPAWWSGM